MRRRNRILAALLPVALLVFASASALCAQEKADSIRRKLDETHVTCEFKETPLREAMDVLASKTGLNIVIDPNAVARRQTRGGKSETVCADAVKLTFEMKDRSAADVLDRLGMDWKLGRSIREELILVGSPGPGRRGYPSPTMQPGVDADVRKTFREKMITAKFEELPLPELLEKLGKKAGRKIRVEVDDEYLLVHPMGIALKDVSLAGWLDVLACIANATWTVEGDEILITNRTMKPQDLATLKRMDETKVSTDLRNRPLVEVLNSLQAQAHVMIVPTPEARARRITLTVKETSLREACDRVCATTGLRWVVNGGMVLFVAADAPPAPGAPPAPVVPHEKRTAADRALIVKLRETFVSFDLVDKPVLESFAVMQKSAGIRFVIDKRKFAEEGRTVTLKLIDAPVDQALRMMLGQLGMNLDYVVIKGKVYVADSTELRKAARKAYGKR